MLPKVWKPIWNIRPVGYYFWVENERAIWTCLFSWRQYEANIGKERVLVAFKTVYKENENGYNMTWICSSCLFPTTLVQWIHSNRLLAACLDGVNRVEKFFGMTWQKNGGTNLYIFTRQCLVQESASDCAQDRLPPTKTYRHARCPIFFHKVS